MFAVVDFLPRRLLAWCIPQRLPYTEFPVSGKDDYHCRQSIEHWADTMTSIGIGVVGAGYMGKAHSVAMNSVGAVFDTPFGRGDCYCIASIDS